MGELSDDLRDMGFSPTGRQSPIDESGQLWSNGHEIVCDQTAVVINDNTRMSVDSEDDTIYRYRNSDRVKLPGGYTGSYDWGESGDEFRY